MENIESEQEHQERNQLAEVISRRADDIVQRWLALVREDAAAARVPLTDLQDGLTDYLNRLCDLLRGGKPISAVGLSAWTDVARAHAITRVRLGFDVTQLFHELEILRRVTADVLREDTIESAQVDRLSDLIEAAMASSLKNYVDFRDHMSLRSEAEHIGFLTHELRNPLGAAVMAVEQLCKQELTLSQQRLCEILGRNLSRIRRLVDDALLTERLQVGEVESHQVDVRLGPLINGPVEVFKRTAAEKNIELQASFDPDLELRADPNLTLSALENLLDNAVKYTDAGLVTFDVEDSPTQVVFHVRDGCNGLSPEELRVIFEPFKRAHLGKPGTGLGLAIARRAIETQGGTIHAVSNAEEGCHFWFTLPKAQH